jgi:hypothetical protein
MIRAKIVFALITLFVLAQVFAAWVGEMLK